VPVPVFCYFCVSKKLHMKYSLNWMKWSPKFLFSPTWDRVQSRDGGGPGGGHTTWWCGCTPGCATLWCGAPGQPPDITLPPIKSPRHENPKSIGVHPRKILQCRRHQRRSSRGRSLCSGTLPGWAIAPGAISIDSIAISINVANSYDEEGVVLPRGWGLYR
jgi:hypothetical protein